MKILTGEYAIRFARQNNMPVKRADTISIGEAEVICQTDPSLIFTELPDNTHDFGDGKGPVFAHRHYHGQGWVADTAIVADTAYVGPLASVFDMAIVSGHASISGNARVYEQAHVSGHASIHGDAMIYGTAEVSGHAEVFGRARVYWKAEVSGHRQVAGDARVHEESDD